MKKLPMVLVGVLGVVAVQASDFVGLVDMKFQTEYVYRGRREMRKAFAPTVEIGYVGISDTEIYAGVEAALSLEDSGFLAKMEDGSFDAYFRHNWFNRISPYAGVAYKVNDTFSVDVGYARNFRLGIRNFSDEFREGDSKNNNNNSYLGGKRDTGEIYAGISVDVPLNPSLYCFYDFGCKEIGAEGKVQHFTDFSDNVSPGLGLDLGAKFGYVNSKRPYGFDDADAFAEKKDYFYYGANADLVYEVVDGTKLRAGISYEGNSASDKHVSDKDYWVNVLGHKHNLWFNAAVTCSF
ncbi:MAG: TonB-dependent receptor [Puniceicoccales bacterium]|jgi:hypothetical protein|nr:TonB-dependent receptor [Puniceicoccales bacterium]